MGPAAISGVSPWGGGVLHLQPSPPDANPDGQAVAVAADEEGVREATRVAPVGETEADHGEEQVGRQMYDFRVRIHEEIKRVIIEVVDPQSGEVMRHIPPEELQRFLELMYDHLGQLLDRRV